MKGMRTEVIAIKSWNVSFSFLAMTLIPFSFSFRKRNDATSQTTTFSDTSKHSTTTTFSDTT